MSAQKTLRKRANKSVPMTSSAPDTPVAAAASREDAVQRLARLQDGLRAAPHHEPPADEPAAIQAPVSRLRTLVPARKGIKSLLAIAVAVALGWIPVQRLLATTSAEATVNARVINLRAHRRQGIDSRADASRRHLGRARREAAYAHQRAC
jgi:hypothetical protein